MTLTLCRTNLATVFAYAHALQDWTVFEDGQPIGRIYEEPEPARGFAVGHGRSWLSSIHGRGS